MSESGPTLTEAEREDLEDSLRWHFAAHASSPEGGYASLGVENALIKVARIKAAARREALLEAAQWFAHEDIDAFGTTRESAQTYTVLVLADEAQRPGGPRFALADDVTQRPDAAHEEGGR